MTSASQSCVAKLTVAAHVHEVIAAELVCGDSVNNRMPTVIEVGVLDDKDGCDLSCHIAAHSGQALVTADLLRRIQGVLRAASVLLEKWM